MSKLKTNTIQHTGGSADNITLDNSQNVTIEGNATVDGTSTLTGNVTASGNLTVSGTTTISGYHPTTSRSNRNLIINGGFQIAQRSVSNNTAGSQSTYHTLDRWMTQIQAGTISEMRNDLTSSDTGPWQKGFRNYMRLLNQSGIGAGSAQYAEIDQRIEAQNVAQSGWDYTSSSSNITLSFWIRASVAQAYVAVIYTSDGTGRHYPFEIKDSGGSTLSANTWTKITKTIPGNSGITVNNDTGRGLTLSFLAAYGTNWTSNSGSFDSWNTTGGGNDRFPDMTNTWATTTNATFDITGVQLEVGSVATNFEHEPEYITFTKCQRYFQYWWHGIRYPSTASGNHDTYHFPTPMRAAPTIVRTGNQHGSYESGSTTANTVSVSQYKYYYSGLLSYGNSSDSSVGGYGTVDAEL